MCTPTSAVTAFGHKNWTLRDRNRLMIAYQQGASLKTISRIVERSLTATNKALSRFGLRTHFGSRRERLNSNIQNSATYEQIMEAIEKYEKNFDTEINSQPPKDIYLEQNNIFAKPILNGNFTIKTKICRTEIFVKFDQVILFAKKIGWYVQPLQHTQLRLQGYMYLLNNYPVRPAQLLVQVNLKRRQQNLPIFCVRGITCE